MNCKHCDVELEASDRGFGKINECKDCATDVDKYVGHMIWDHKTAPVIEIHANKQSLSALKDGRYNEGLKLVREVKERSRRREGDTGSGLVTTPYIRKNTRTRKRVSKKRSGIEIKIRSGSGRTYTSFSLDAIKQAKKNKNTTNSLTDEKKNLLLGCARLPIHQLGKKRVEIWKDERGFYIRQQKRAEKFSMDIDMPTAKSLGYRGANFSRV